MEINVAYRDYAFLRTGRRHLSASTRGCCCCYSLVVVVEVAAAVSVVLPLLLRLSAVVQHTCLMKYGAIMPHNGYLGPLIAIPGLIIRLQLHSDCDCDCDSNCDSNASLVRASAVAVARSANGPKTTN